MHAPGESMGSLYRVKNLCQGLTSQSHNCYIFTPFHYFEDWGSSVEFMAIPVISSKKGINLSKFVYRIIRKILDIKILSNYTLLNPKVLNYIIDRISKRLLEFLNEIPVHLDVIIGETEIGGLVLTRIKNYLNIPIIVDYQNYWPEELVEHKVIKRHSRRYRFLVNLEREVISRSNFVICICDAMAEFLRKKFNPKYHGKIRGLPNGGFPALDAPKEKILPPKIINSGMVVQRSNFKLFLQGMQYVLEKYPNSQIFITRKGEKLKEVMKLAKKMKINVNFYWKDTDIEYLELLSQCHVGVVTSANELTRKLGFVAKIYDYFSVGIPVVGNDIGGFTKIISKEEVGLLSSNEPRDLAEKIIKFIENPELAYNCGERGIKLLKGTLSIKESSRKLIEYIEEHI